MPVGTDDAPSSGTGGEVGALTGILRALLAVVLVPLLAPAAAGPAPQARHAPCAGCVAIVVTPGTALALPERLDGLRVFVAVEPDGPGGPAAARSALEDIAQRGGRPGLLVAGVPAAIPDTVMQLARAVLVAVPPDTRDHPDALAFALKTRLTDLRAGAAGTVELGIVGERARLALLLSRDLAPYLDVVVTTDGPLEAPEGLPLWRVMEARSTGAALEVTRSVEAASWLWRMPPDALEAGRAAADLARAARWLRRGLIDGADVRVRCGPAVAETFLDPQTLDTIALVRCDAGDPITVVPEEPGVERVVLSTGESIVRVPAPGAPDRFAAGVDVVGTRQLSVEEIIARHQAAAARQAAFIETLVSRGTLTLTFEAPGFPAPVTITAETTIYAGGGRTELEQRRIRLNGIAFPGGGVPRLPIIEPERVSSPPLTITLTDIYRYRLRGRDEVTVDGARVPSYVVAFEPVDSRVAAFRGRAWIAAGTFALVRVAAAQTGLRGPIVSSEQVDEYREAAPGAWLLARSDVRQVYEGAAHRTPIHRVLAVAAHEINAPDFTGQRQAAYASDAVMLRDTAEGFRYLRRERKEGAATAIEPVVAGRAERIRTLIGGVILDPNITRPLPFAGLTYVDFNLFGTGTQLNAFFGGTYGQLAFSVPALGGSRWQAAGRAFGIATRYNDRSFVDGRERYDENIRQQPAHASVWLLRPLTPRIAIRLGYDLDYTRFSAADVTAPGFRVPAHQVAHGARVAIEGQRGGWNGSAWWNPAVRTGWRAWGWPDGGYDAAHRRFQRYGLSLSRSAVLNPALTARIEGAWMAGRDLDRFSRYAFGTFENRLRGYPSALIRYDRGGVVRGALAWSPGRLARLDLFLDSAQVRDPGFGRGFRNYTGFGAAVEMPAPFGMLVAAEWGYGLRGVTADGGTGTHVIRVSAFKLF